MWDLISLILFGSQARGDITAESDIDILVVLSLKGDKGVKSLVYKGKSLKSPLKKA